MAVDISHNMGGGFQVSPSGDIATVTGTAMNQQRILRRLLTNLGDYIWNNRYGAGLPSFIGKPPAPNNITAVIRGQLALESTIAKKPAPVITVSPGNNSSVFVKIKYTDAADGATQTLSFPLG